MTPSSDAAHPEQYTGSTTVSLSQVMSGDCQGVLPRDRPASPGHTLARWTRLLAGVHNSSQHQSEPCTRLVVCAHVAVYVYVCYSYMLYMHCRMVDECCMLSFLYALDL